MDEQSLNTFREKILQELEALSAANEEAESATRPVELDKQSVGRLSRMDAMQGQAMALATKERKQKRLIQLKAALMRIDEDNFGYCQGCDEPINLRRLAIEPTTLFCLECASKRE